jgi:hypothetical protein
MTIEIASGSPACFIVAHRPMEHIGGFMQSRYAVIG